MPSPPPSGKFALLIIDENPPQDYTSDPPIDFSATASNGVRFAEATLEELVRENLKWWRSEMGELRWRSISRRALVVMLTRPAAVPGVLDRENELLEVEVNWAWYGLVLARPMMASFGEAWRLSGHG